MLRKNKWTLIVTSLVIMIPILIGGALWNRLPDTLATHWGTNNVANGFSSKPFTVFGMPLILLFLQWLCVFGIRFDKRQMNQSPVLQKFVLWIIPACSILMCCVVYGTALGYTVNVGFWCMLFLGVSFVVIGNYLPKCKQSYTIGIRIFWTLNDEEVWNKTHRLAGFLWVIGGLFFILTAFFQWYTFSVAVVLLLAALIPVLYAGWIYRKKHH